MSIEQKTRNKISVEIKEKRLGEFAEDFRDVRLILKDARGRREGYVVMGYSLNEEGEETSILRHYHISDWGAVPLRLSHITPLSMNGGTKGLTGLIKIDSNYEGVF